MAQCLNFLLHATFTLCLKSSSYPQEHSPVLLTSFRPQTALLEPMFCSFWCACQLVVVKA